MNLLRISLRAIITGYVNLSLVYILRLGGTNPSTLIGLPFLDPGAP